MKYLLVFAFFLVTVYCFPKKTFPNHGSFPKYGSFSNHGPIRRPGPPIRPPFFLPYPGHGNRYPPKKPHHGDPNWFWKLCKTQPTLSTVTQTPSVPVTTVQTSPQTSVATAVKTTSLVEELSTPGNNITRGDI